MEASLPPPAETSLEPLSGGPLPLDGRVLQFFPDAGLPPQHPPWLRFRGNRVVAEEIYRNALHLPDDAPPNAQTAAYIEESLYGFLLAGGYELATVAAVVRDDHIDVQIDEGQLEKVVFTGRLTFDTLRFRLELFLDGDVFNRPALQRQVDELSRKIGIKIARWELVPTPHPEHFGFQLESLGPRIEGFELIHARKRYELWFYFQEDEWRTGPGIDLRSGYIDGLEIIASYQGIGLFDDRWRIAASGGGGIRYSLQGSPYVEFSRAYLEARWYSRAFGPVRGGVYFNAEIVDRQRKDLGVEKFLQAGAVTGVDLPVAFSFGLTLTPVIGVQWLSVFDDWPTPNLINKPIERFRSFVGLDATWIIDPKNPRWDRQHRLDLGGRYFWGRSLDPRPASSGGPLGIAYESYQKVFELGWHDLWLRSHGRVAFGDILFTDEQNLGEILRGVFGSFVRKGGNLEFEFRFSLSRDVLKVSFFTQIGAWGEVYPRSGNTEYLRLGVATGPGLHALIQGMFQMDLYASIGLRTRWGEFHDDALAIGFVALLNKTF